MNSVVIVQASDDSKVGFKCYGQNSDLWRYRGLEVVLSGPFETGKTMTALHKFHLLHCKYPRSQGLMLRKTYKSLMSTAVVTFEKKVLPYPPNDRRCPIHKFGGERPEWYDYPNGSRMKLGGLDNPDWVLSGEYDWIYVNQAEELTLNDWETLTGRVTGRAGNTPYSQIMGDCNPGPPTHWILHRPSLKVFYSRHEDNPTLYNPETGEITKRGEVTMSVLDALTGVRYKRGRLGIWAAAEGQVYEEYDPAVHLIKRFEIPSTWRRFRVVDFGFTNPFVCLWIAVDHDGRMYVYREIYKTQRIVADHAQEINRLSVGERFEATVADHDAEDRATLERAGIRTVSAWKQISPGIQAVAARLRKAGDGKPRLFYLEDSLVERDPALVEAFKPTSTIDEFPLYVWPKGPDGKSNKEVPVDEHNHGMDCLRYGVMYLDPANAPAKATTGRYV